MARQGLMDDAGYDLFDVSDCANYESCREDAYNDGYADAIDECIKVMKYCWYNGQQPLDVLVSRLEQLKEQNK